MRGDGPHGRAWQKSEAQKTWSVSKGPTLTRAWSGPEQGPATGKGARWGAPGAPEVGLAADSRAVLGLSFLPACSAEKKRTPSSPDERKGLGAQALSLLIQTRSSRRAGSR